MSINNSVINRIIKIAIGIVTISCLSIPAIAYANNQAMISEFRAVYALDYDGIPFTAKGVRELKKVGDGIYLLSNNAESMVANIIEESTFSWIPDQRLQPNLYEYHLKQPFGKRDAILNFDWQKNIVVNDVQSKPWKMAIPEGTLDKLSYQLQLRYDIKAGITDVTYPIADGGKLKMYQFKVLGEEQLTTPLGEFNTVKVQRVRETGKKRNTVFWLAKDFDYLLVKLKQTKKKGDGFELTLEQAILNGEEISVQ